MFVAEHYFISKSFVLCQAFQDMFTKQGSAKQN
jgi:hypothetical protein